MAPRPLPVCELADGLHHRLVAIARAALPNEACGLLSGPAIASPTDRIVRVDGVWPVANQLRSPQRFALDGAGMIEAEQRIESVGSQVIGVFHSHPASEARPSATDRADAARWDPDHRYLHLIVSMQGFTPAIRAWHLAGGPPDDPVVERRIASAAGDGDGSHSGSRSPAE